MDRSRSTQSGMLVVTPAPFSNESMMGYVLRLSGANGQSTPWWLYQLAGLKQSDVRTCNMRLDRLAHLIGRPISALSEISFKAQAVPARWGRLLGHRLISTDLVVSDAKFCTLCAAESGYIEAHWQLRLTTGCPVHCCKPTTRCTKCQRRVTWFRPNLLTCSCGADLLMQSSAAISTSEASLLSAIRTKFLNLPASGTAEGGVPHKHLRELELHATLNLVELLGRHRLSTDDQTEVVRSNRVVAAAATVLADWPKNFHCLIADLAANLKEEEVSKAYRSLYTSFFKGQALGTEQVTDFLRRAFLGFLNEAEQIEDAHVAFLDALPKRRFSERFLTASRLASATGVRPVTAIRYMKHIGSPFLVAAGQGKRLLLDKRNVSFTVTKGEVLRARQAAAVLGIPVHLLQALRKEGVFEVRNIFPSKPGFHIADVTYFRERLVGLAAEPFDSLNSKSMVSLGRILRNPHDDVSVKAKVIRAILSSALKAFSSEDGSIGSLRLDKRACQTILSAERENRSQGIPVREAAKLLECDPACIPVLCREGRLYGQLAPTGLKVDRSSLGNFKAQWRSLASLSKELGTSSRSLVRTCQMTGIPLLAIPTQRKDHLQPFISRASLVRLLAHQDSRITATSAKQEPSNENQQTCQAPYSSRNREPARPPYTTRRSERSIACGRSLSSPWSQIEAASFGKGRT
jgi:hypothetical protein